MVAAGSGESPTLPSTKPRSASWAMVALASPLRLLPLKTLTTTWSRRTSDPAGSVVSSQIATGSSSGNGSVKAAHPHTAATSTSAARTARVSADLSRTRHWSTAWWTRACSTLRCWSAARRARCRPSSR